jgi:ketosteroid isomerase-like protein
MNRIAAAILLVLAWVGGTFAQAPAPVPKGPSTEEAIKQLDRDWWNAEKAGDTDKLGQIIADDWTVIGYDGKKTTKQGFLADMKSGKAKLESFELGPMDVKVLGNVAVAQGSNTEKSITGGKETNGKWVWTDVFAKRKGKWVAVRSQYALLK